MIYIDGGSNTSGDELDSPEIESWPAIFSKLSGKEVINGAVNGKSNDRIIFDTINECLKEHKPEMVIIAFAPIIRKFYVRRENNFPIDISVSASNSVYHSHKELKQFQSLLFKYWSNILYDSLKFLQSIVMLQSFLKQQNIPYFLINADDQSDITKLCSISNADVSVKMELLDAFDEMDDETIISFEQLIQRLYNNIDHKMFHKFEWYFQKLVSFKSHPTKEQHVIIADYIYKECLKLNLFQ